MVRNRRRRQSFEPVHDRRAADLPYNTTVVADVVDDPFKDGERIAVLKSIRNDPLLGMLSRKTIDRAQFEAGRKWQKLYETAGIGLIIAMDPLKEPVDGHGASRADITDAQLDAFAELKYADSMLGWADRNLVRHVLADGLTIVAIAIRNDHASQWGIRYIGMRFRDCLEALAVHWGLVGANDG